MASRLEQLRQTVATAKERASHFIGEVRDRAEAVYDSGVRMAAHLAYHPAGILLDVYGMNELLQLDSRREAQILHALTSAELGRQINQPLVRMLVDSFTGPKALPGPTTSSSESTAVVPYGQVQARRSPTADAAIQVVGGLTTHFIQQACERFEQVDQLVLDDAGITDEAERQRLLTQIPRLRQVARQFVGQVAGDAYQLFTATDEATVTRILQSHGGQVAEIVRQYHASETK